MENTQQNVRRATENGGGCTADSHDVEITSLQVNKDAVSDGSCFASNNDRKIMAWLPECQRSSGQHGIEQRLQHLSPIVMVNCENNFDPRRTVRNMKADTCNTSEPHLASERHSVFETTNTSGLGNTSEPQNNDSCLETTSTAITSSPIKLRKRKHLDYCETASRKCAGKVTMVKAVCPKVKVTCTLKVEGTKCGMIGRSPSVETGSRYPGACTGHNNTLTSLKNAKTKLKKIADEKGSDAVATRYPTLVCELNDLAVDLSACKLVNDGNVSASGTGGESRGAGPGIADGSDGSTIGKSIDTDWNRSLDIELTSIQDDMDSSQGIELNSLEDIVLDSVQGLRLNSTQDSELNSPQEIELNSTQAIKLNRSSSASVKHKMIKNNLQQLRKKDHSNDDNVMDVPVADSRPSLRKRRKINYMETKISRFGMEKRAEEERKCNQTSENVTNDSTDSASNEKLVAVPLVETPRSVLARSATINATPIINYNYVLLQQQQNGLLRRSLIMDFEGCSNGDTTSSDNLGSTKQTGLCAADQGASASGSLIGGQIEVGVSDTEACVPGTSRESSEYNLEEVPSNVNQSRLTDAAEMARNYQWELTKSELTKVGVHNAPCGTGNMSDAEVEVGKASMKDKLRRNKAEQIVLYDSNGKDARKRKTNYDVNSDDSVMGMDGIEEENCLKVAFKFKTNNYTGKKQLKAFSKNGPKKVTCPGFKPKQKPLKLQKVVSKANDKEVSNNKVGQGRRKEGYRSTSTSHKPTGTTAAPMKIKKELRDLFNTKDAVFECVPIVQGRNMRKRENIDYTATKISHFGERNLECKDANLPIGEKGKSKSGTGSCSNELGLEQSSNNVNLEEPADKTQVLDGNVDNSECCVATKLPMRDQQCTLGHTSQGVPGIAKTHAMLEPYEESVGEACLHVSEDMLIESTCDMNAKQKMLDQFFPQIKKIECDAEKSATMIKEEFLKQSLIHQFFPPKKNTEKGQKSCDIRGNSKCENLNATTGIRQADQSGEESDPMAGIEVENVVEKDSQAIANQYVQMKEKRSHVGETNSHLAEEPMRCAVNSDLENDGDAIDNQYDRNKHMKSHLGETSSHLDVESMSCAVNLDRNVLHNTDIRTSDTDSTADDDNDVEAPMKDAVIGNRAVVGAPVTKVIDVGNSVAMGNPDTSVVGGKHTLVAERPSVSSKGNVGRPRKLMASAEEETEVPPEEETEVLCKRKLRVGILVWGMFGKGKWWPGIIIDEALARKASKPGFVWLYWFSDKQISQLRECHLELFHEKFSLRYQQGGHKKMKTGIIKALQVCAERAGIDVSRWASVEDWAMSPDGIVNTASQNAEAFSPKTEPLPQYVLCDLEPAAESNHGNDLDLDIKKSKKLPSGNQATRKFEKTARPETGGSKPTGRSSLPSASSSSKGLSGMLPGAFLGNGLLSDKPQEACFVCEKMVTTRYKHPLFEVKICIGCKENLKSSLYAVDDDGTSMFCCVCGDGGKLFVCHDTTCGKAYCFECVMKCTSPVGFNQVKESSQWQCFMCTDYSMLTHGRLVARADWSMELVKFFQPGNLPQCEDLQYMTRGSKRKLRVLSLFDGLGTGKVALDELGLDVEVYYVSEVHEDAMAISSYHHAVTHLGDIWNIDKHKLTELCPIDLVIGGPPCNDLSIVNPDRKGFNGTGILVMKFMAIVKDLEALCKGKNHVFWLMENTGHMKTEYKQVICNILGMEPAVWDAKYFTGQHRARNFWGNLPGMYSTPEFCKQLEKEKKDLDWALISNCNRKAVVSHTRTITTSSNSLTITNGKKDHVVSMNGIAVEIWVQELERLFGFPTHYTDVGELSHTRRRKLLGKAWSVPVIKHLLSPLRSYFKVTLMLMTSHAQVQHKKVNT